MPDALADAFRLAFINFLLATTAVAKEKARLDSTEMSLAERTYYAALSWRLQEGCELLRLAGEKHYKNQEGDS